MQPFGSDHHTGGNGSMLQRPQQQQHPYAEYAAHHAQPSLAYTSAPYSQLLPAQAPLTLAPIQHPSPYRHSPSASPQHHLSPAHAHGQLPASPQALVAPNQHTPPGLKYPMAAPPLPQTPASNPSHQQQQPPSAASPRTPQSPSSAQSQSTEQAAVSALLDINADLLLEVNRLQAEGKGGAISPHQLAQLQAEGKPASLASEEYIQVLRRVQANLGYLMPKAQNDASKIPKGPALMTPPPHMPHLLPKYEQLKELFPDWQGIVVDQYHQHHSASMSSQAGGSPHLPAPSLPSSTAANGGGMHAPSFAATSAPLQA